MRNLRLFNVEKYRGEYFGIPKEQCRIFVVSRLSYNRNSTMNGFKPQCRTMITDYFR